MPKHNRHDAHRARLIIKQAAFDAGAAAVLHTAGLFAPEKLAGVMAGARRLLDDATTVKNVLVSAPKEVLQGNVDAPFAAEVIRDTMKSRKGGTALLGAAGAAGIGGAGAGAYHLAGSEDSVKKASRLRDVFSRFSRGGGDVAEDAMTNADIGRLFGKNTAEAVASGEGLSFGRASRPSVDEMLGSQDNIRLFPRAADDTAGIAADREARAMRDMEASYADLQKRYDARQASYADLQKQYNAGQASREELAAQLEQRNKAYADLNNQYAGARTENAELLSQSAAERASAQQALDAAQQQGRLNTRRGATAGALVGGGLGAGGALGASQLSPGGPPTGAAPPNPRYQ